MYTEHENPFPDQITVIHELGHFLVSCCYCLRSDGITFYPRNPEMVAIASYSNEGLTSSQWMAIAVAGAVATSLSASSSSLAPQTSPETIFLEQDQAIYPQFLGDRQRVNFLTSELGTEQKRKAVRRAIARACQKIEELGGPQILLTASSRILAHLDTNDREQWRTALEVKSTHTCFSFDYRNILQLMSEISQEVGDLRTGAKLIVALIERQKELQAAQRAKPIRRRRLPQR